MPIFNNILAGSSGQGDTGYDIDQSLRFEDGDSAKLDRTPSGAGNRKTWTWSCWVKHSTVASDYWENLFGAYTDANNYAYIVFEDDVLRFFDYQSGSAVASTSTSEPKYRDPSAWRHIVVTLDTTQATDTNRLKFYINGEQLTLPASVTYPSQNSDGLINSAINHRIGGDINGEFDGYLAEMHFIDGTALDASSFGETNANTNQWVPIEYTGSYGTNGFYLPFSNTELNNFVDSSSSSHTITANGDVTHSRVQKKIGSSSIYFDQTDALSCADNSDFDFGAGQFTVECWVRFQGSSLSSAGGTDIITKYDDSPTKNQRSWGIKYPAANNLEFRYSTNGSSWAAEMTFPWTPSLNTWYHVAVSRDGSGDIRAFIDGTQIGSTQNVTATFYNSTALLVMGADMYHGSINYGNALDGYMDEIRISNTARYTSNFTPSTTAFSSDANTKLLIHSDFDGGLGADYSGNFNDFSVTNLVATDQVTDSPTQNYATLNSVDAGSGTLSEGNLKSTGTTDRSATFLLSSGKWAWKVTADASGDFGVASNGLAGTESTYSASSLEVLEFELDLDANTLKVRVDGGGLISVATGLTANAYVPLFKAACTCDFGQSGFSPTDGTFKTLNTDNLPNPSIADPTVHFSTTLWSGNDAASRSITTGVDADFVWYKDRTGTESHSLYDSIRGAQKRIISNSDDIERTRSNGLQSFDSTGFTVGSDTECNGSGKNYVGWNWKAAAANTSVSAGSIDGTNPTYACTRRTNSDAGFSIVSYTATGGSSATVAHGLSQAPELIICKNRSAAYGFATYNAVSGADFTLFLNTNAAVASDSNTFPDAPSSTIFNLGASSAANGRPSNTDSMIAYCWHSVEGYSKIGGYIGNANADGPFVYTGFRPAFVIIKATAGTEEWYMFDNKRNTYNSVNQYLHPNSNGAENGYAQGDSQDIVDFLSNGFKIKHARNALNTSGSDMIYLAFAESPFKYSNAR